MMAGFTVWEVLLALVWGAGIGFVFALWREQVWLQRNTDLLSQNVRYLAMLQAAMEVADARDFEEEMDRAIMEASFDTHERLSAMRQRIEDGSMWEDWL